ncbi:MAG: hypothetical protein JNK81_11910 [Anaerolineales bacterium]|nr:hypothetical protein [Anaerolineales bacterium]
MREENEVIEDWEEKLLDDINQPKLYDVIEVLSIKDNINKLANVAVLITLIKNLSNTYIIPSLILGQISLLDVSTFFNFFLTLLGTGLDVALIYFPLKALAHILRILMEMELNSRNAK